MKRNGLSEERDDGYLQGLYGWLHGQDAARRDTNATIFHTEASQAYRSYQLNTSQTETVSSAAISLYFTIESRTLISLFHRRPLP